MGSCHLFIKLSFHALVRKGAAVNILQQKYGSFVGFCKHKIHRDHCHRCFIQLHLFKPVRSPHYFLYGQNRKIRGLLSNRGTVEKMVPGFSPLIVGLKNRRGN